jgi:hypothetical protein
MPSNISVCAMNTGCRPTSPEVVRSKRTTSETKGVEARWRSPLPSSTPRTQSYSGIPWPARTGLLFPLRPISTVAGSGESSGSDTFRSRSKPTVEDYSISQNSSASSSTPSVIPRSNTTGSRRRVPYKEPRLWQNSHPITTSHCTVRIRGIDAT